jgi:hypothetical protein
MDHELITWVAVIGLFIILRLHIMLLQRRVSSLEKWANAKSTSVIHK